MAPPVQVPANFGRQHIGSPSHSNLLLHLKEGKTSRANSLILSYNSPVIERLVRTLELTSLDLQDFEEAAVGCFVDCLYTGEIEMLDKPFFREVNKMASVFDVAWLVARCVGYFKEMVEAMNVECYEDMFFLFEEARYVFTALKKRGFLDLAVGKIGSGKGKPVFINRYMEDVDNLTVNQLDLVIELAGDEVNIVVHSLTDQLTKHLSVHGAIFTVNHKHLLDNSDLELCRNIDRMAYECLFDVLQGVEGISVKDCKWVLNLHRMSTENAGSSNVALRPLNSKISNLFYCYCDKFDNEITFDDLVDRLASDVEVKNLLMFAEALWYWLMTKHDTPLDLCSPELLRKIVTIKSKRGWNTVHKSCFWFPGESEYPEFGSFFSAFRDYEPLFESENNNAGTTHVIEYECTNQIITEEQLVTTENTFMFYFKDPCVNSTCYSRKGQCGFILKTTPATAENPDSFDIRLCTDHSEYPDEIHLHEDTVRAENMHFMTEYRYLKDQSAPYSWFGKPCRSADNTMWVWKGHFYGGSGEITIDSKDELTLKVLLTIDTDLYRAKRRCLSSGFNNT